MTSVTPKGTMKGWVRKAKYDEVCKTLDETEKKYTAVDKVARQRMAYLREGQRNIRDLEIEVKRQANVAYRDGLLVGTLMASFIVVFIAVCVAGLVYLT